MREHPERKKSISTFKEATRTWGSYDDFPLAIAGVDPAPHLSRSKVPQPFHLVTELDEVLVTMSGAGHVEFRTPSGVTNMDFSPGDVIYLPARMPARIIPRGEIIQVRLKSTPPFREAAVWFCETCGDLVHSVEFTAAVPQQSYWDAVSAFNSQVQFRRCGTCDAVAEPADLGDIVWNEVAEALAE